MTRSGRPLSQRSRALRLLDERDAFGGRLKAALFLLHPGPSLLVTAVTVAAAGIALHAAPPASLAARLVLLMLPAQLAIGAANDLADLADDRAGKPHKPLARGAVPPALARVVVAAGVACSLASAATLGAATLAATAIGLAAGLAYDAGLKRGPGAVVAWWAAFAALPVCAFSAAGHVPAALWACVPLAAPLAVGLHVANALPDAEHDRARGIRSLPVLLGAGHRRTVAAGCIAAAVVTAAFAAWPLGQAVEWWGAAAAALLLGAAAVVTLPERVGRVPAFAVLAGASALFAVAWLAALPP